MKFKKPKVVWRILKKTSDDKSDILRAYCMFLAQRPE